MKNPIQASALTLGTARNADAFPAGLRVLAEIEDDERTDAACEEREPRMQPRERRQRGAVEEPGQRGLGTTRAPPGIGSAPNAGKHHERLRSVRYTVNEFSKNVGDRTTAAHPNHAAPVTPRDPPRQFPGETGGRRQSNNRKTITPR